MKRWGENKNEIHLFAFAAQGVRGSRRRERGGTTCLDELTSFERQIGKFPHSAGTSLSPPWEMHQMSSAAEQSEQPFFWFEVEVLALIKRPFWPLNCR